MIEHQRVPPSKETAGLDPIVSNSVSFLTGTQGTFIRTAQWDNVSHLLEVYRLKLYAFGDLPTNVSMSDAFLIDGLSSLALDMVSIRASDALKTYNLKHLSHEKCLQIPGVHGRRFRSYI